MFHVEVNNILAAAFIAGTRKWIEVYSRADKRCPFGPARHHKIRNVWMNHDQNSVSEQMIALQRRLADTGRQLEQHGQLCVEYGDSDATAALAWLKQLTGTVKSK